MMERGEGVGAWLLWSFHFQGREGMELPGAAMRRPRMWPTPGEVEQRHGESSSRAIMLQLVDQASPEVSHTFGLFSYKSQ